MLVKTHDGYIKIDRDGNKFPVNPQKWTPQKEKEVILKDVKAVNATARHGDFVSSFLSCLDNFEN